MIKKSDNITSILALIVVLAALTVAIVALVNNKKDDFTATDSSCCVENCDNEDGWCIGTQEENGNGNRKSLVFNCKGTPKLKNYFRWSYRYGASGRNYSISWKYCA